MYYVQYGTFYKYENAHRFLQIVKQNGIPAKMSYDGSFFHIVSLQSFEDKATAILVKIGSYLLLEGHLFVVKKNNE